MAMVAKKIRWLVGYPKSGTTWVRMFLNALATGFPLDINSPYQYASSDMDPRYYHHLPALPYSALGPTWLVYYRQAALCNYLLLSDRDPVLRTHWPKVVVNDLHVHPPVLSRGAIILVRDPRDIAVSLSAYLGNDLDDIIRMMGEEQATLRRDEYGLHHYISSWSRHFLSWTEQNGNIPAGVVRYEDLVTSPQETFRAICEVLYPFPFDQDRLQWAIDETRFPRLKRLEQGGGFREMKESDQPFFRKGIVGDWENVLTPQQVWRIESDHREVMEKLGYEREGVCA